MQDEQREFGLPIFSRDYFDVPEIPHRTVAPAPPVPTYRPLQPIKGAWSSASMPPQGSR